MLSEIYINGKAIILHRDLRERLSENKERISRAIEQKAGCAFYFEYCGTEPVLFEIPTYSEYKDALEKMEFCGSLGIAIPKTAIWPKSSEAIAFLHGKEFLFIKYDEYFDDWLKANRALNVEIVKRSAFESMGRKTNFPSLAQSLGKGVR